MKLLSFSILIMAAAAANAQLINGDFEAGTQQNPFPGWQSTGTATLTGMGNPGQAVCFTFGGGSVSQTFNCGAPHPGEFCRLTFDYKGAPGSSFNVSFTGAGGGSNFGSGSAGALLDNQWHTKVLQAPCGPVSLLVTGNGAPTQPPSAGMVCFDNFTAVCAVPEPASMAALGLGAAALIRRRKIRSR